MRTLIRELVGLNCTYVRALEISMDLRDSDILVPLDSCPSLDVTNKPKLLLKSTSSLSPMDVISKTLPPRHVAPVNCYLNHLPFTVKARCHSPVRFINSTRAEIIVSKNYRMPIYRTFQYIEEYIVSNLPYRVSRYSQNQ